MIPILFVNCHSVPFVQYIMEGKKIFETRSRHVLRSVFLYDMPILIAETGKGKPIVKCSARIRSAIEIFTAEEWEKYRMLDLNLIGNRKRKRKYCMNCMTFALYQFPSFRPKENVMDVYGWNTMERKCNT